MKTKLNRAHLLLIILASICTLNARAQLKFDTDDLTQQIKSVRTALNDTSGISIVVSDKNDVIYEYHDGMASVLAKVDLNTPFYIASTTKAIFASMIWRLHEKQILDMDEPVSKYIEGFEFSSWFLNEDTLTIADLLKHEPKFGSAVLEIRTSLTGETKREELLKLFEDVDTRFFGGFYSNLHYIFLGLIVEEITGKSWKTVLMEEVLVPLEMSSALTTMNKSYYHDIAQPHYLLNLNELKAVTYKQNYIRTNTLMASGGLFISARDVAKFTRMILNDGKIGSHPFISSAMVERVCAPQNEATGSLPHEFYALGLGFELARERNHNLVTMNGSNLIGYRSYMSISPQDDISIVITTNANELTPYTISLIAKGIYNLIDNIPFVTDSVLNNHVDRAMARSTDRIEYREEGTEDPFWMHEEYTSWPENKDFVGTYESDKWGSLEIKFIDQQLHASFGNLSIKMIRQTGRSFWGSLGFTGMFLSFDVDGQIVESLNIHKFGASFEKIM